MPGTCCSSHAATLSCDSVATSRDPGHDTLLQRPGTWDWVSSSRLHTCGLHSTHAAAHTCAHAHTHASHTSGRRRRRRAWAPGGGVGPVSTAPGLCGQPPCPWTPEPLRHSGPRLLQTDPAHLRPCHTPIRPASFPLLKIAGSQGPPSSRTPPASCPSWGPWLLSCPVSH